MRDNAAEEIDDLTDAWTEDVIFFVRTKGFAIDGAAARAIASRIARSIVDGQMAAAAEIQVREVQAEVCRLLGLGASKAAAAEAAGVSAETLRMWAQRDLAFRRALGRAVRIGRAHRIATPARRAPRRMTSEVRDRITTLLSGGATRMEALGAAGVSKQTFYTWLHRAPDFRTAVLAAEGRALPLKT